MVWQARDRVSAPHEPTGQAVLQASGENETTELEPLAGGFSLIELSPGETVGPYVVVRRVGAGAMGVVYEAHDPRLDRKVAIKVLRRHALDPTESAVAEARLLREARALAQLSHPNVVPVYDVGTTIRDDHEFIFLAMEFVQGQTLREWIAEEPPIARVLAVMKQAGRGLAAAHAAGLVHRDFKLDNVIIDASGRARVMDFGLARALTDVAEEDSDDDDDDEGSGIAVDSVSNLGATLTRAGTVMGTPVYMSPEQHVGRPLTARSDQFSYCVALYEALYGRRPFIGSSTKQLARAKLRGQIRRVATGRPMADLVPVIDRGLDPNPAKRWPSMKALLRRLKPKSRRPVFAIAAGVAVVATGMAAAIYVGRDRTPCDDGETRLGEAWSESDRDAIHDTIGDASPETAELVVARLDAYAASWVGAWKLTCNASAEASEDAAAAIDRQALCLDRRRSELETAVDVLGSLETANVARASFAVAELTPAETCLHRDGDASMGDDDEPVPGTLAAVAYRLYRRANVRSRAGQYALGVGEAFAAMTLAAAADHAPTLARAEMQAGVLLSEIGEYASAERMMTSALWRAQAIEDDAIATSAAAHLCYLDGVRQKKLTDGLRWCRLGRAFAARLPDDTVLLAHVLENEANILDETGRRAEAIAQMRHVLELREAGPQSGQPRLAMALNNLGTMLMAQGIYDEAREKFDRALAIRKEVLGPAHPDTGMSYINLGALAAKLQRYDEAIELSERGLEIYRATVDRDHPSVATALQIMAGAHTALGRYDEAETLHEELLAVREKLYGRDHISLADTWSNIGAVYANQGRYEEAEGALSKALAIYDATEAHESQVAFIHYNLGTIAFEQGQYDKAEGWFERSLEMWAKGGNPKNSDLSYPLAAMGRIELERGQPRAALPYLERAHELVAPLERSGRLAVIDFALARALWPDVDRRGRAWELVQRAQSELATAPPFYADDKAELDAWIEAHRAELPVTAND